MVAMVGCSGITAGVGVDPEKREITLGELTPTNGSVSVIGIPLTRGHEVYFQYVNEVLGGAGQNLPAEERYTIVLKTLDTAYSLETHVEQYNALKDDVLAIAQSLGTEHTKAILDQIRNDEMLTGAATLSSEWLKERYVVSAGAPYPAQAINAAQYLSDSGALKDAKIGVIYQEDDYGADGLRGLEYAATQFGFEIVSKATYKPTDMKFRTQVATLKTAGATVVFLVSVPSATGEIAKAAEALGYAPRFIGLSRAWIHTLAKDPELAPYLAKTLWIVADASCQWGDTSAGCEGMKEMLDNIAKFAPDQDPDYNFLFGYVQARIIHQIIEGAIEDRNLTRAGLVKAFEELTDVDMGGLLNTVSYGPKCEDKIPTTASTINKIDPAAPIGLAPEVQEVDSPAIDAFPFC
jgi:ABC-type branched-subunit amino acid transport system substrate-binding protein